MVASGLAGLQVADGLLQRAAASVGTGSVTSSAVDLDLARVQQAAAIMVLHKAETVQTTLATLGSESGAVASITPARLVDVFA